MLSTLEKELVAYAESFYTDDEQLNRNLRLKLAHTFRVRNETTALAAAEAFPPEQARLAVRAALLHDLSRFEQFSRFRSFNDAESFDHGDRSAELAVSRRCLDDLTQPEQDDVLAAIRVHNKVAVPPGLTLRAGKLARAVRDADKLAILPILIGYLKDPENKSIVFGLDSTPELSPVVRDTMLRGECPRHRDMRTVCDFVSCKLLWAHDLNFNWSRDEFRKRGYLESIRSFLPDTPLIRQIYDNARNALQPQP